jgi:hypothetical protein
MTVTYGMPYAQVTEVRDPDLPDSQADSAGSIPVPVSLSCRGSFDPGAGAA